jgi:hypothetical protein
VFDLKFGELSCLLGCVFASFSRCRPLLFCYRNRLGMSNSSFDAAVAGSLPNRNFPIPPSISPGRQNCNVLQHKNDPRNVSSNRQVRDAIANRAPVNVALINHTRSGGEIRVALQIYPVMRGETVETEVICLFLLHVFPR